MPKHRKSVLHRLSCERNKAQFTANHRKLLVICGDLRLIFHKHNSFVKLGLQFCNFYSFLPITAYDETRSGKNVAFLKRKNFLGFLTFNVSITTKYFQCFMGLLID